MTPLVLDSGVAVKWFVAEPHAAEAGRVFDEYLAGNLTLLAPDFIYAEFGNILWKKQAFQGYNPADAQRIVDEFRTQITLTLASTADLLDDAYRIAVAHKRTVYDSLYLALGVRAGCRSVTADEKLVNAVGAHFANVVWLAKRPAFNR
jgi:predicted nucleic acid-binding protein